MQLFRFDSAVLLVLLSGLSAAACNPITPPPAGSSNLEKGNVESSAVDCDSTLNSALLKDLCSFLGCTPNATCGSRTEELFAGDTLTGNSALKESDWSYMGGRGELMANGALCALRDLADGPVINSATASLLGGSLNFTIEQKVGFEHFDAEQKVFKGYQTAHVCIPAIGCFDANRQRLSAQVVTSEPANPIGLSCGKYKIANSYGLQVTAEESNQSITAALPSIPIETPYGQVLVTPVMGYTAQMQTQLMPAGGLTGKALFEDKPGNVANFTELLGRIPGTQTSASLVGGGMKPDLGWESQVGIGSRQAADPTSPTWNGTGSRPDLDLGQARSDAERIPTVSASAGLHVDYSPTDVIPSFLKSSPLSLDFDVFANTDMGAEFTEQFAIFFGEDFINPTDLGSTISNSRFTMKTRAQAHASLTESVGINLKVSVDFAFFSKTLVDLHPKVSIPLDSGQPGDDAKDFARGDSGSNPSKDAGHPTMNLAAYHAGAITDPAGFVDSCLQLPPPADQVPPSQPFVQGNANQLNMNLYPCNICLGNPAASDPKSGQSVPNQVAVIFPSQAAAAGPSWSCNVNHIGCFDTCRFDPVAHTLKLEKTALDLKLTGLDGQACNYTEPH